LKALALAKAASHLVGADCAAATTLLVNAAVSFGSRVLAIEPSLEICVIE
jgi:hypothetical protein